MIVVNLPDTRLAIVFTYHSVISTIRGSFIKYPAKVTRCEIFTLDASGHCQLPKLARGETKCCFMDHFVKATGRKIALTRALSNREAFTKFDRTQIWDAYWNRS